MPASEPACPLPLQDAFGAQPIQALLAKQGLDAQLQQALLHGVLLLDGCTPSGSGGDGDGFGDGGALPAGDALERLRMFVQSAGRYGSGSGGARACGNVRLSASLVCSLAWLSACSFALQLS